MTKRILLVMAAGAVLSFAHHGYSEYDRDATVSLEGTVESVMWGNPHVLVFLQTEGKGTYRVEWNAIWQLSRSGIQTVPIKQGDRVVVTGSVNRNPEKHILTLVQEISRPSDGWRWVNPRYRNSK